MIEVSSQNLTSVIPVKTGIQVFSGFWIPTSVGMTEGK